MEQLHALSEFFEQFEPDIQRVTAFIAGSIVTGGCKEIGSIAAKNFSRILSKYRDTFRTRNGRDLVDDDLGAIPISVRAEFFRVASLVSEDEIQEAWALLLSSFTEDPSRYAKVKFISILHNMDGLDTVVFKRVYECMIPEPSVQYQTSILTRDLPLAAHCGDGIENQGTPERVDPSPAVQVSLENLERLSLIKPDLMWTGPNYSAVFRTRLGSEFAKALLGEVSA
jgi:hypothetical protein